MAIDTADTSNRFFVGATGDHISILMPPPPQGVITRQEALNLAAWLVAIADIDDEFDDLLQAIRNT